jgi:hypothetical protein
MPGGGHFHWRGKGSREGEAQAVGLKPVSRNIRHVYVIRRQQNSESYLINAKSFLGYYGIDTSRTLAFQPQVEEGVLVFELDKGVRVMRRGGRRKGAVKKRRC